MNTKQIQPFLQQRQMQKKIRTVHFRSEPIFFLYIYYVHFIAFLLRIYNYLFLLIHKSTPVIETIDETQLFIDKHKKKFIDTFFDMETKTIKNQEKWNENIDINCYSELPNLILQENNDIELQWKKRLLYETTPRGNIIMYYDLYKQAFAYVSDQQMTYDILNACAMKYVRIFHCLDFFVDVNILPFNIISPFSLIQEEINKKEKEIIIEKKKEIGVFFDKDAPFIKPKSTNTELKSILKTKKVMFVEEEDKAEIRDYRNIFRYLGKISNLPLLIKTIPVKTHPVLSIPVQSFDYVSFKKLQQQKKTE
jgi:hypothetical protein